MYKVKPTNIPEQSANNERKHQVKEEEFSSESIIQIFLHSFGTKDLLEVSLRQRNYDISYFKCFHRGRIPFLF